MVTELSLHVKVDLPTYAYLLGTEVNARVLRRLHDAGHAHVRTSHGYVCQLLLGGPRTTGELARMLEVSSQAVSKLLREMEAGGYVERTRGPDDARKRYVALTPAGREMIELARAARAETTEELRRELGARRVDAAARTLRASLDLLGMGRRIEQREVPMRDG